MPPVLEETVPAPLLVALAVRLYWIRVNVAVTVFAAVMLVIVQVAAVAVPPVESQAPVHATVEPVEAVAVKVTAVP